MKKKILAANGAITLTTAETTSTTSTTAAPEATAPMMLGDPMPRPVYNLILLDESGSMGSIEREAIAALNETIQGIRKAQETHLDQRHFISLVSFSGSGMEGVKVIRDRVPAREVADIRAEEYCPNSCTPLYDAMGFAITSLDRAISSPEGTSLDRAICGEDIASAMTPGADPDGRTGAEAKSTAGTTTAAATGIPEAASDLICLDTPAAPVVIVTIITDGMENSSRIYSSSAIRELVAAQRKKGWTFAYIGANQDSVEVARSMNIKNAMDFEATPEGMKEAGAKYCASYMRLTDKIDHQPDRLYDCEGIFDEE